MISVAPLTEQHDIQDFRSGSGYLDHYLQKEALTEQASNFARTFVALDTESNTPTRAIGYFTLKISPQYLPQLSGEWVATAEIAYLAVTLPGAACV